MMSANLTYEESVAHSDRIEMQKKRFDKTVSQGLWRRQISYAFDIMNVDIFSIFLIKLDKI
jgi:hypothetical protein